MSSSARPRPPRQTRGASTRRAQRARRATNVRAVSRARAPCSALRPAAREQRRIARPRAANRRLRRLGRPAAASACADAVMGLASMQAGVPHGVHAGSAAPSEAHIPRKDKSLGILSRRFMRKLLYAASTGSSPIVSLEQAARALDRAVDEPELPAAGGAHHAHGDVPEEQALGAGGTGNGGAYDDSAMAKTRLRRLYDIANVLSSVHLIEKVQLDSRKPAFKWAGITDMTREVLTCPRALPAPTHGGGCGGMDGAASGAHLFFGAGAHGGEAQAHAGMKRSLSTGARAPPRAPSRARTPAPCAARPLTRRVRARACHRPHRPEHEQAPGQRRWPRRALIVRLAARARRASRLARLDRVPVDAGGRARGRRR